VAQAAWRPRALLGSVFPCMLCASGWCAHRAVGTLVLQLLGLALLWAVWARSGPAPGVRRWRHVLAASLPLLIGGATLIEWFVDVEPVVVTGALIGLAGALLVTPAAPGGLRAMGVVGLGTALAGYHTVLIGRLSPMEAHVPLLVVGLAGFGASVAVLAVVAIAGRRAAG
jgi:hypothetical protein